MSSIYPKRGRLYLRLKVNGKWVGIATEFVIGQERQARAMLDRLEAQQSAGEQLDVGGPPTVASWSPRWLEQRKAHVGTWRNDDSVMRLHVLPVLGALRLDQVRPKHLVELVRGWRSRAGDDAMAPKSIYNAYSTVSAFFRDAALEDLVASSPCVLTKHQLGPKVDANPEWRQTAVFSQAELELLISDPRVSLDRRVLYALQGVAGLRHGEAAGLLWRNCGVQPAPAPLGMLLVAFSYERPFPKGDVTRPVPIHPTLAAMLAEWKLHGWERLVGRAPTSDDLVVPLPGDAVSKRGRWRRKEYSLRRLGEDLEQLGLRHRRGHDLRRTFISLARSAGAERDILRRATHRPPREVIEGYTSYEWPIVCREVAKLAVHRLDVGKVLELPRAVAVGERATRLLPDDAAQRGKGSGAPRTRTPAAADASSPFTAVEQQVSRAYEPGGAGGTPDHSEAATPSGSTVASAADALVQLLGGLD